MENRAIVIRKREQAGGHATIKLIGNQRIAGAIYDAMTKDVTAINAEELRALKKELRRMRAREGVRKRREDRDWIVVQAELERKYGSKVHGELYHRALVAWALASMIAVESVRRLFGRCGR